MFALKSINLISTITLKIGILVLSLSYCILSTPNVSESSILQFYHWEPFDKFVGQSLHASHQIKVLEIRATKGEYEPASFIIHSKQYISGITVDVEDAVHKSGEKIPAENIDVRIVKVWEQLSKAISKKSDPIEKWLVPELLVKDDLETLKGEWIGNRYFPPTPQRHFFTNLLLNEDKQIWVQLKVPDLQHSGVYSGKLRFNLENVGQVILPIKIHVLPFSLPPSHKVYGIYVRSTLSITNRQITEEMLRSQLQDIKNHGLNSVAIYEHDIEYLREYLSIIREVGLSGPIITIWGQTRLQDEKLFNDAKKILDESGLDYYFYSVDEPDNIERGREHIDLMNMLHNRGVKVATALRTPTNIRLQHEGTLDWANYKAYQDDITSYNKSEDTLGTKISPLETVYWGAYREIPVINRYLAGVMLWKSGFDGVFPYCYQAFHSVDPYQTDMRESWGRNKRRRVLKCFCTTYPTTATPIPTIQWESYREGIDDLRYLRLVEFIAEQLINSGQKDQALHLLKEINQRLSPLTSLILTGKGSIVVDPSAAKEISRFRQESINLILKFCKNNKISLEPVQFN